MRYRRLSYPVMNADILAIITHRRRQLLVHSVMYYRLCTSIIEDSTFDRWAYELRDLQRDYPEESASAPLAAEFADWDGTTGYDLPYNAWALRTAQRLIESATCV
jgi:hypothetical protein